MCCFFIYLFIYLFIFHHFYLNLFHSFYLFLLFSIHEVGLSLLLLWHPGFLFVYCFSFTRPGGAASVACTKLEYVKHNWSLHQIWIYSKHPGHSTGLRCWFLKKVEKSKKLSLVLLRSMNWPARNISFLHSFIFLINRPAFYGSSVVNELTHKKL